MANLQLIYEAYGLALWLGSLALAVILAVWLAAMQVRLNSVVRHYRQLCRGVGGGNLQDVLERHLQRMQTTTGRIDDLAAQQDSLDNSVKRALQRIGVVRFNPFSDVGGDQSFSVAMLDARGDGIVISSLFGRKESRVYVKPIEKGSSKYALSAEEEQAIHLAHAQTTASSRR